MSSYYFDGTMAGTEGRGRAKFDTPQAQEAAKKNPVWGFFPGVQKTELAAYLATVNRGGGRALPATLQTLPRPKGKATQVIVTQYDMPRRDTVPHDSDVDSKGWPWYTDQSDYFVGTMNPQTGEFKEWPLPKAEQHEFGGASDIQIDKDDNPWFSVTHNESRSHFGKPGKFDPKTGTYTYAEVQGGAQFMALAPDGGIIAGGMKIDAKTMKLLDTFTWNNAKNLPPGQHAGYEPAMDSKGNWYITDFGGSYIVKVDGKTKDVSFFKTPTVFSQPRRGRIDSEDRYWFGEYTGDNITMFDTKANTFKEWPVGKWFAPYTASLPDKNGHVYSPSNSSDRVFRLDPKTGELVGYLMPTRDFDAKQLSIDPISKRAVWLANVRNARLVKIEPID